MFKIEGMFKNLFKNIFFFKFSGSVPESKGIWGQNGKMGVFLPFKDKR